MGRARWLGVAAASGVLASALGLALSLIVSGTPARTSALGARALAVLAHRARPATADVAATVLVDGLATGQAGTGIVVSSNGLVLTNNHVISDALRVAASVAGRRYRVRVVAADPGEDLALVQLIGAAGLATTRFAPARPAIGERVVALGNALGLGRAPRLASGELVALGRTVTASDRSASGDEMLQNMIEADVAVEAGYSGGPLLDAAGEVIGVDTAAARDAGRDMVLDFAIPSVRAAHFLALARAGRFGGGIEAGAVAWLGLLDAPGSPTTAAKGVSVAGVIAGGPAAAAGIVAGDLISSIDGRTVASLASLEEAVARLSPGARCTIELRSDTGDDRTVVARLGALAP